MQLAYLNFPGEEDDEYYGQWVVLQSELAEFIYTDNGCEETELIPPGVKYVPMDRPEFDSEQVCFYIDEETLKFPEWLSATGTTFVGEWQISPTSPDLWETLKRACQESSDHLKEFESVMEQVLSKFGGLKVYQAESQAKVGKTYRYWDQLMGDDMWEPEGDWVTYDFTQDMVAQDSEAIFWDRHYGEVAIEIAQAIPGNPFAAKYVKWVDDRNRKIAEESAQKERVRIDNEWNERHSADLSAKFGYTDPTTIFCRGGKIYVHIDGIDADASDIAAVESAISNFLADRKAKAEAQKLQKLARETELRQKRDLLIQQYIQQIQPLKEAAEQAGFVVVIDPNGRTTDEAVYVQGTYTFKRGRRFVSDTNPPLEWFCEQKKIYSKRPILKSR